MTVRILDDVSVSPLTQAACAFPVACRLQDGGLLCAYRRGTAKHSRDAVFLVQRSMDDGRTWGDPVCVFDGMRGEAPESVHAGAVGEAPGGPVLALFTAVEATRPEAYIFSEAGRELAHKFYVARSEDGGRTWLPPESHHIPGAPPLAYINSRPLPLDNGDLLVPLEITTAENLQASGVARYESSTGVFRPLVICAKDAGLSYGDPKLARLSDGRILMLLWTFVNASEQTISAHACISADEGRTWSAPRPTGVVSQIMTPHSLGDRRLIAAGNIRIPPEGIRLSCSENSGDTWETEYPVQMWDAREEKMLGVTLGSPGLPSADGKKIWSELPGFSFGTPDLIAGSGETLLLTYYTVIKGRVGVRACRFEVDFPTDEEPKL
ncbi:MAG: sialidase family protein [Verrucomicrobiota bacterium]